MKVYGYGCYCFNLGDRPLSGIMTGVYPVDNKDMHCFEFTKEKETRYFLLESRKDIKKNSKKLNLYHYLAQNLNINSLA